MSMGFEIGTITLVIEGDGEMLLLNLMMERLLSQQFRSVNRDGMRRMLGYERSGPTSSGSLCQRTRLSATLRQTNPMKGRG